MEQADRETVDRYLNTCRLLFQGGSAVFVRDLEQPHKLIVSTLHQKADRVEIDVFAFAYSFLRLPDIIPKIKLIVLGQSEIVFRTHGYSEVADWLKVPAPARRRKMLFDGKNTLAAYITSPSDVDDLATILTALQIEWNKIHQKLQKTSEKQIDGFQESSFEEKIAWLQNFLEVTVPEAEKLLSLRKDPATLIADLRDVSLNLKIRVLEGSLVEYTKATQRWWKNINNNLKPRIHLNHLPVYIISSNLHSLSNLISPFCRRIENEVITFIEGSSELDAEWQKIVEESLPGQKEDFLYFVTKKYLSVQSGEKAKRLIEKRNTLEIKSGLMTVLAEHYLDVNVQVLPISKINFSDIDLRLKIEKGMAKKLAESQAVIFNFDYPLGLGAYHLLQEMLENVLEVRGVYILGKAATLSGEVGDVMIPSMVADEHSGNTYFFNNSISASDVSPLLYQSSVLDHQKSVTVKGTYLQNMALIDEYVSKGITVVEMEAGPYLNAVYEACFPDRYPEKQYVHLSRIPFDFGAIYYASDTHYSRGKSLGSSALSFEGVSPTYVSSIAILKRIFEVELTHLD